MGASKIHVFGWLVGCLLGWLGQLGFLLDFLWSRKVWLKFVDVFGYQDVRVLHKQTWHPFNQVFDWKPTRGRPGLVHTKFTGATIFRVFTVFPVTPRKLTWQWKIHHVKMYFLLKMGDFRLS